MMDKIIRLARRGRACQGAWPRCTAYAARPRRRGDRVSAKIKRREFIALLGGAALSPSLWPRAARAQRRPAPVIGFLGSLSPEAVARPLTAFRKGLEDTGFRENETVVVEYRW